MPNDLQLNLSLSDQVLLTKALTAYKAGLHHQPPADKVLFRTVLMHINDLLDKLSFPSA